MICSVLSEKIALKMSSEWVGGAGVDGNTAPLHVITNFLERQCFTSLLFMKLMR